MTNLDALPDRNASDEDRYEPADALCDVCERRPGEIAQDGIDVSAADELWMRGRGDG